LRGDTALRIFNVLRLRGWKPPEEHESALSAIETGGILREGTTHNTKVSEDSMRVLQMLERRRWVVAEGDR
jgi:hypothetical protein